LKKIKGKRAVDFKKKIQQLMWEYVGIIRSEKTLRKALGEITKFKKQLKTISVQGSKAYNHDWIQYIDVLTMLSACEAIIRTALFRKESRGAHFRKDYPKKNDKWQKNIIAKIKKGKMSLTKKSVPKMPKRLGESLR